MISKITIPWLILFILAMAIIGTYLALGISGPSPVSLETNNELLGDWYVESGKIPELTISQLDTWNVDRPKMLY